MKNIKEILQAIKTTFSKIFTSQKILLLPLIGLLLFLRKKLALANSHANSVTLASLSAFLGQVSAGTVTTAIVKPGSIFYLDNKKALFKTSHNLFPKSELFSKLM
jgi:hypothetical protein